MTIQEIDKRAFELFNLLYDTTNEYIAPFGNGSEAAAIVSGAANLYMASYVTNAANRQAALELVAEQVDIVTQLVQNTPEEWFTTRQLPDLN